MYPELFIAVFVVALVIMKVILWILDKTVFKRHHQIQMEVLERQKEAAKQEFRFRYGPYTVENGNLDLTNKGNENATL